jgi:hypothetical protein
VVYGKPTHPSGKPLIQPKLAPPIHGDQVAEPLVSELMSYNVSNAISVAVRRGLRVEENSGCTATCQ